MVMRTCTGSGTAEKGEGEMKGKNGGLSPNNREIAGMVSSGSENTRLFAFMKTMGSPRALAYLAVTAQHEDVREAAKKEILKNSDALFKILDSMTSRYPQAWERELVTMLKESINPSESRDAKILVLKIWQLERSPAFSQTYSCKGTDGELVEIIDESPVQFNEGDLANILDATQE